MEHDANQSEFGRRLRAAREGAGLGVSELARLSGVSRRHVTEAEAGRANLSIAKIWSLSRALRVKPATLVDFELSRSGPGRIALVGLRGAGKSSVGRELALLLEVPFVELDRRVEELAGLSLASLFELHGVAHYRSLEAEALERVLAEGDRIVLATGGSIVQAPKTFARLDETCHTVWLKARAEIHYERVAAQGDRRPMLGRPRAMEELRELLDRRSELYSRCRTIVETSDRSLQEIARELAQRFDDA